MKKLTPHFIKWGLAGIILTAGLAAMGMLYAADAIWFEALDKADEAIFPHRKVLAKFRNRVEKSVDGFNFLRDGHLLDRAVDVYDLSLSPKDVNYFLLKSKSEYEKAGFRKPDAFRKVTVIYQGVRHAARMKLHGDGPEHWTGKKKSFQLKFGKDDFVEGKKRLLFILPDERDYVAPIFANELAKRLHLPHVESKLAHVRINSVSQGLYYVEERIDEKYLESHGMPDRVLVKLSDNWVLDREEAALDVTQYYGGITYDDHHTTPFDFEISNLQVINHEHAQRVIKKTLDFFDAVRTKDMKRFEAAIDIPSVGAFDAWRTVMGDRHAPVGDNLRMAYSLSSGKFLFIPRSEGMLRDIEYKRGNATTHLNQKAGRIVPILEMMTRSVNVRQVRKTRLHDLLQHEVDVLNDFDRVAKRYLPVLKADLTVPLGSREIEHKFSRQHNLLANNLKKLQKQFEYVKAYVNVVVTGNEIDLTLIPDTSSQSLELTGLRFELKQARPSQRSESIEILQWSDEQKNFSPLASFKALPSADLASVFNGMTFGFDFDENLYPALKRHRFKFLFHDRRQIAVERVVAKFRAEISGKPLPPDDVYIGIADANDDVSDRRFQSPGEFRANYPELNWASEDDRLVLPAGRYDLSRHVIAPEGTRLRFEPGVTLRLGPGVVFLSYSPIEIKGTADHPVTIQALTPGKPFGTFAVVDAQDKQSVVEYLDLSGGNEAFLNGIYFLGALCFYHSDVKLAGAAIHDNHADDGLNVKNSKIEILDSKFENNSYDQVDLDYVEGAISNSIFSVSPGMARENGDGLDVSGSRLILQGNVFRGLTDKGVSVGEASKVALFRNTMTENNIGVASKDSSRVLLEENDFRSNTVAVAAYRKKQIFDGGYAYLVANRWEKNRTQFDVDTHSKIFEPSSKGETVLRRNKISQTAFDMDELFTPEFWKAGQ